MSAWKRLSQALLVVTLFPVFGAMIDRLVFFPDRSVGDPPPGVEELWLTAADGVRLNAWLARSASARATLVWSHGNGGNIANRAAVLLTLASRGLDVLAYDYRGYGKSRGSPSEAGVYLDSEAAFDAERGRGTPPSRIVCFGESLGGAVSIHLANLRPCAAVVVVSSFPSLREVARVHYGSLGFLAGTRFDSASLLGRLSIPFFAIHGDRDTIVPYALGERLFALAREPKQFLRVPGAGHNDIFEYPSVIDGIVRFITEHVTA